MSRLRFLLGLTGDRAGATVPAGPDLRIPYARDIRSLSGLAAAWLERQALFVTALAAAGAILLATIPLHLGQDSWLALVAGRQIAQHGIPTHDSLAVLTHGASWIDQQWLSQLALYEIDRIGGIALYGVIYVALGVGAVALAIIAARRLGASDSHVIWALPLCGSLFLVASMAIRTQGLAYPLFVTTLWLLASDRRAPSRRVYLVFGVLVLWANIHGSVILGAGMACIYGVTLMIDDVRHGPRSIRARSLIWLLAPPGALLMTPYGVRGLDYYTATLFNPTFKSVISEWAPVTAVPALAVPFFALAVVILALVLIGQSRGRGDMFERLTLVVLIAAGAFAVRNVIWLGLASLILLPSMIGGVVQVRPAKRRRPAVNLALAGATLLLLVSTAITVGARSAGWFEGGYDQRVATLVTRMTSADPKLQIYADDRFGDWLLWRRPSLVGRVAYDSRLELLTSSQLSAIAGLADQAHPGERRLLAPFGLLVLDSTNRRKVRSLLALPGVQVVLRGHGVIVATNRQA